MISLFSNKRKPTKNNRRARLFETLEGRKLFAADLGQVPPDMISQPYAFVGDHSPSNSEIWSMQVGQTTVQASGFGEVERQRLSLEKGKSYPITVSHIDTNIEVDGAKKPDYDYRAWIDKSANPAWTSSSSTPTSNEWFVDNSSGLLQKKFWGDDTNEATGTATLHIPMVDLDIDSNNNRAFDENDDWIELDSRSGRLVDVLVGDVDRDGIDDRNDLNGITGASFEPVKLSLSSNLAHAGSGVFDVTITYDMADAAGNGGDFRLWRVDASSDRSDPNTLVRSGTSMSASSLGLSPGASVTLYLEAVNDTGNTAHFEKIDVNVNVSASFFYGTLSDSVYAAAVVPDNNAVAQIVSVSYESSAGQNINSIKEGDVLIVHGIVKYRAEVSGIPVTVWVDLDLDDFKDEAWEVRTATATPTGESNVSGDRFYSFTTAVYVLDDGPVLGDGIAVNRVGVTLTPDEGEDFESEINISNVAPTWSELPKLVAGYHEDGTITNPRISAIFSDEGAYDIHTVEILVNGQRKIRETLPYQAVTFEYDLGILTPSDGERIEVRLTDDDTGTAVFYITLGSVVSKSYIDNIYTTGGVGSVTYASAISNEYGEFAADAANVRLQAFAVGSFAQFREHPEDTVKDKNYRLYSRQDYAIGSDGTSIKYIDKLFADYDAGAEAFVFSGAINPADEYTRLASTTKAQAGFSAYGKPDPLLEPGFNLVMARTSTNIWHVVEIDANLVGGWATFSIRDTDSSAFPSNKVWINEREVDYYKQATFVSLWQSSPKYGRQFVVGRDEAGNGVFEMQPTWWMPEEEGFV